MGVCDVCGLPQGQCNTPAHEGAGLSVIRLNREENSDMARVELAAKDAYLNADKTQVVDKGDAGAAWLLCRKGSPIAPEVAAFYGVETYTGEAVSKVALDEKAERKGMVTPGTSPQTEINYERMKVQREVYEEVVKNVTSANNPGATRQAALMAEAIVNKQTGNVGENYAHPGNTFAIGSRDYRTEGGETNAAENAGEQVTAAESLTLSNQDASAGDSAPANTKTKTIGEPGTDESGAKTGEDGVEIVWEDDKPKDPDKTQDADTPPVL